MTPFEALNAVGERISRCRNCDLCLGATRKCYDRSLIMYYEELPIPILFVGMSPAYCEDRTGIPLVGPWELATSRCGRCESLTLCFDYFLHEADQYKDKEIPCPYSSADPCKPVPKEKYVERLQRIPKAMTESAGKTDMRTAGHLLDSMLFQAGIIRSTQADYWDLKKRYIDPETPILSPNASMINTVQCITMTEENGKRVNRPPTEEERIACAPNVARWLCTVQPQVIVALGMDAMETLCGLEMHWSEFSGTAVPNGWKAPTMKSIRGTKQSCSLVPEHTVIPIYHPSYYLRTLNLEKNVKKRGEILKSMEEDVDILKKVKDEFASR